MSGKSLKVNAILNGVKMMMSVLFPLITFPYVSRILQVENLGKVNFSSSVISYFVLLAGLGITTYAIREGSRLRNESIKFNEFANQVFTINLIATMISYISLFFIILFVSNLQEYRLLLIIQSFTIIFSTIGVEWIFSIYEDYLYITIRSLIFQILSMILLFTLIRDTDDYYLFAIVTVISSVGSNLYNFIYSRKYFKVKLTKKLNLRKHLKPILVIFSTSIATTIYVNSDLTMLGIMTNDYEVGVYSVSSKVYSIIKTLMSAVIIVALPRLSYYIANNNEANYKSTVIKIFNSITLIILPTVVGINLLSKEIIFIISGNSFMEANVSLKILSIALIFSVFGSFATSSILLPMKKEKYILFATIIGATINVLLNLVLIPLLQQNGAAITTAVAELFVMLISFSYARKYIKLDNVTKNIASSVAGCLAIVLVGIILKKLIADMVMYTVLTIFFSIIVYLVILLLLRNNLALELVNGIKRKFKN